MSEAFRSAFALHAAGSLSEAEAAYREILADEPGHSEAQHYLGVLLHQRGQTEAGIALILAALEANAGNAWRYNDLGNILAQTESLANAAAAFKISVELDGDDANAWNNLGSVLQRLEDMAAAENAYRQALSCDENFAPALNNLASLLAQTGREEEATILSCRAFLLPPLADKTPKMLGIANYRLGRIAQAAQCYREWLRAEPDNAVALQFLAACTGQAVPARAPDAFVTAVFDELADDFDAKLVGKLAYRGPAIIADLLKAALVAAGDLDVLDGGCGTGLCAPVLAPYAKRLTGVDLSSGMLARARQTGLYGELVQAELTDYLRGCEHAFDLIAMADTLIYFGELSGLFAAVKRALRLSGAFAFTVELPGSALPLSDYELAPSGRYGHGRRYLEQEIARAGFTVIVSEDVVLRSEFCQPARGLGVLVRAA